ncbi:MAG: YihA family ribosome biogenesis GTP-binding protein [Betaproteobacteria bacterium]|nr:YihA family ribosome biogenesis GTP-binding protein [Betaproteobacteria bacterium]
MAAPALFRQARFETSVAALEMLPPDGPGEIAFAGRSNAGKSSALNTLADHKRLAFVSKTPGRTQLINYFDIGGGLRLVDLPGYGYAKVPDAIRALWGRLIGDYVLVRRSLKGLALIMDVRRPMTDHDLKLLQWFGQTGKPVHVMLTKSDKLARAEGERVLATVRVQLAAISPMYTAQLFSSLKRTGVQEAEAVFAGWLGLDVPVAEATLAATRRGGPTPKRMAGMRAPAGKKNPPGQGRKAARG